jgi:hypothetical protein
MIIGNGLIAKKFKENFFDENYIIFASGVSSSKEDNDEEYIKEEKLLSNTINNFNDLKIIYFSSVLCDYYDNKYYKHKKKMENIIINNSKEYLIFRLPQLIGNGGNKNNIFNFFVENINNEKKIEVQINSYRSLIDINDFYDIVIFSLKVSKNEILKFSNIEKISVKKLVKIISKKLKKELYIDYICSKPIADIKNSKIIEDAIKFLNIKKIGYTKKIINKYL